MRRGVCLSSPFKGSIQLGISFMGRTHGCAPTYIYIDTLFRNRHDSATESERVD